MLTHNTVCVLLKITCCKIRSVCYSIKIFQQFKICKRLYGHIPTNIFYELKLWYLVNIYLICSYDNSIISQPTYSATILNKSFFTWTIILDPEMGWFYYAQILCFNIYVVVASNNKYIDKSSDMVIQLFNQTWGSRYPRPCKVVFDNRS